MSVYLDRAHELRSIVEPHYNCAQSVLIPFAEQAGYTHDQAFAVASAFGGGMKCGNVCGALTGALMALGVTGVESSEVTTEVVRRFGATHNGMICCADLLAANERIGGNKKAHCDGLVFDAVKLIEEQLA